MSVQVSGGAESRGWRYVSNNNATLIKPVVLDLDGDGIELTGVTSSPGYDFFADGHAEAAGWFTGGDGLLVFDGNLNGLVDNGSEISFLHHSPGSSTDLQALTAFDSNQNGWIDAGDTLYQYFRIWKDLDLDGISDAGELQTLAAANVASISLQSSGGGYEVNGNEVYGVSAFTRVSGGTGSAYDVGFEAATRGSKQIPLLSSEWTIQELDTGERVAVAKTGAAAMTIIDAASYTLGGTILQGFQLTAGADSISTSSSRALYIDAGAGNDTINLSLSSAGSVIKAGAGDDYVYGTTGDDYISLGSSIYGDGAEDDGGNDYYFLSPNSWNYINDTSGITVVVLHGYTSSDLNFSDYRMYPNSVWLYTDDGTVGAHVDLDFLVLDDGTMTRAEIDSVAIPWGGYYSAPSSLDLDVRVLSEPLIA